MHPQTRNMTGYLPTSDKSRPRSILGARTRISGIVSISSAHTRGLQGRQSQATHQHYTHHIPAPHALFLPMHQGGNTASYWGALFWMYEHLCLHSAWFKPNLADKWYLFLGDDTMSWSAGPLTFQRNKLSLSLSLHGEVPWQQWQISWKLYHLLKPWSSALQNGSLSYLIGCQWC